MFSFHASAYRRPVRLLTAVGLMVSLALGFVMSAPVAASAADASAISVDGRTLNGAALAAGDHVAQVAVPAGVSSVKFVLDGNYLGEATTAPFQWRLSVAGGTHKLSAHWGGPAAQRISASFTVSGAGGAANSGPVGPGSHKKKKHAPAVPPVLAAPVDSTASSPAASVSTGAEVNVSNSTELARALVTAVPGESIRLANGVYTGKFVAAPSGTAQAPITLAGSRSAVLTTGSTTGGYGLHVTGSYWVISGLSVTRSGKGIVLDGSQHTRITGVDVGNIGDEGVHFRHNSSDSSIVDSTVHDTGLKSPGFGEGIYIGSAHSNWASVMGSSSTPDRTDRVVVEGNYLVNIAAEGIDVKEGTTGGSLLSNVFMRAGYSGANSADSWVDVKGNGYVIQGNSGAGTKADAFQVHRALPGWGVGNHFFINGPASAVPGFLVNAASGTSGNSVQCQPTWAARGLSNIACTN